MFLAGLRLKKKQVFNFINIGFLLKRAHQYSGVAETDTRGFLLINQSELERDKFGLIAYCFISKAKQIIDESNIMSTKLVKHGLIKLSVTLLANLGRKLRNTI